MDEIAKALSIVETDAQDGNTVLRMAAEDGSRYELRLNSIHCQSLIQMLAASLSEALQQPQAESGSALTFEKLQLEQAGETLYVRMFLTPQVYHQYQVPMDSTVAHDLMIALQLGESRNAAKVNFPSSGTLN